MPISIDTILITQVTGQKDNNGNMGGASKPLVVADDEDNEYVLKVKNPTEGFHRNERSLIIELYGVKFVSNF